MSGRLPEVKVQPPLQVSWSEEQCQGNKRRSILTHGKAFVVAGGGGALSFCTYGSRDQARVLMYVAAVVIVPAQFTGGCQRGLCHECDEDTACCDKSSQIQHIQTELMKQAVSEGGTALYDFKRRLFQHFQYNKSDTCQSDDTTDDQGFVLDELQQEV